MQPPPQVLAQERRDRDRRGAQLRPGAAALAPDDGLLVIRRRGRRRGPRAGARRAARSRRAPPPCRRGAPSGCRARGARSPPRGGRGRAAAPPPGACGRARRAAGRRGACAALSSSCSSRAGELALSRRQARSQSRRSCRDVAQREAGAQPFRCRVLQLVRLVEHDGVVLRQHADGAVRGDAQPEIGEVERVVDDDRRRRRRPARAPPRRSTWPRTCSAPRGSARGRRRPRPTRPRAARGRARRDHP